MKQIEMNRNYNPKNNKVRAYLDDIISLLRKGWSRSKCVKHMMNQYDMCRQTASKYVHDAYVDIYEASAGIDLSLLKEQYIDRIESMLQTAIETNKFDQAARLQEMLNRINGMYVDKQEIKAEVSEWKFDYATE